MAKLYLSQMKLSQSTLSHSHQKSCIQSLLARFCNGRGARANQRVCDKSPVGPLDSARGCSFFDYVHVDKELHVRH